MSTLNYIVCEPISFVGGPWRAPAEMAEFVLGRVVTVLYRSLQLLLILELPLSPAFKFGRYLEHDSRSP